jgi:hypothetical protein
MRGIMQCCVGNPKVQRHARRLGLWDVPPHPIHVEKVNGVGCVGLSALATSTRYKNRTLTRSG